MREKDRPRHAKPKKMPMNLLKESKPKAWCSVTVAFGGSDSRAKRLPPRKAKWLKKEEAKQVNPSPRRPQA